MVSDEAAYKYRRPSSKFCHCQPFPFAMQYSLSCLLLLIGFVFQVKSSADDSLFNNENLGDPAAFVSGSSSDVFSLTSVAGNLVPGDNGSFDTLVPPPEDNAGSFDTPALLPEVDTSASLPEDESSYDTFALPPGAEDAALDALSIIPYPFEFGSDKPELSNPPNEQDNALKEKSPLDYQAPPGDNNKCRLEKTYQLCCSCNGDLGFEHCTDCLQSKPSFHFPEQSYSGRSPKYGAGV